LTIFDVGEVGEVAALDGGKGGDAERAGAGGQVAEPADALDLHVLGDAVVVVAADAGVGVTADPLDARGRLRPVVHQVAQAQADVVRLGDRFEGGSVAVDVGQEQHAHGASCRGL
jgi:hypothetical protein